MWRGALDSFGQFHPTQLHPDFYPFMLLKENTSSSSILYPTHVHSHPLKSTKSKQEDNNIKVSHQVERVNAFHISPKGKLHLSLFSLARG